MQTADDENPDHRERGATSRRVQERITEMHDHRAVALRARQAGQLSERELLKFQARVIELAEELRPFRDDAGQMWDQAGPDGLGQPIYERVEGGGRQMVGKKPTLDSLDYLTQPETETTWETVGFGRRERVTRERPGTLPFWALLDISRDLDDIAAKIGFEVAPDTPAEAVHGGKI